MNNLAIHKEIMQKFDYSALDVDTEKFLQDKEIKIKQSASTVIYHYTKMGKEFKEAQEKLSKNGYGCFADWFTSLGFKKDNVYNLIGRYNLIVGNYDKRDFIETLPVTLTYEMSKKSADPKLNEKVFNGENVNLKEYRQLKKQKKEAEQQEQLTGQIDIVEVTAIEVVEDKQIETTQDTQTVDTIYNIALDKIKEIEIRQGEYWSEACCIGDLKVSKESSIFVAMYLNKEITLEQMYEVVKKYRLDIPVSYAIDKEEYFKQLDTVSSSYKQYIEGGQYAYDVVSVDLDYKTVIECEFEEDKELRKEYGDGMKSEMIQGDNIILTVAYDDGGTEHLVIYFNKKLIANYRFHCPESDKYKNNDWAELERNIFKLFELDNIDKTYIGLLHKLKDRCDKANEEYTQTEFKRNKESAKFIYKEKNYTFLIMPQRSINKGDRVLVYKRDTEIGSYDFEEGVILGEFCLFEVELNWDEGLKEIKEKENIDNEVWENFTKEAIAKHKYMQKKANEEWKKQHDKAWDDFGNKWKKFNDKMSSSSSSGNKLIDGIAKLDKAKKKNIYKALSKHLHPDLGGSTELMQFVTELKEDWGI